MTAISEWIDGQLVMVEWFNAKALADIELRCLPHSKMGVHNLAQREKWRSRRDRMGRALARRKQGRGGGWEYHYTLLPAEAQEDLTRRFAKERMVTVGPTPGPQAGVVRPASRTTLWEDYERASEKQRETAEWRLAVLDEVEGLYRGGMTKNVAVGSVARRWKQEGAKISARTIWTWFELVAGLERSDWLPALAPRYVGRQVTAECDPRAWDWYRGHYLTRSQPTHADTYDRLKALASAEGWVIPSAATLRRRVNSEVENYERKLRREGPQAAATVLPKQDRDALVFGAGEAVNGDGLKFDRLWVRFPDGEILNTATGWFYQDLRTRRILAWRLDKTENTDLFRLATYDLTGVCAPDHLYVDNTTVAANKLMTAGTEGRRRFKSDPEDGQGLLLMLGIEVHFTNPDKETGNPGAKPIERAFGIGGLHEMVATNPSFVGRGFSKKTAITVEELRAVISHEVARHNAKTKRRNQACGGILSFDQAWEAAITEQAPRVLSERQRRLLLLSREVVRANSRDGHLALKAGMGPHGRNRYWSAQLPDYAGKKLAVHYDPENLHADVHVYGLDGRYLFAAECLPSTGFNNTADGREWGKFKSRAIKAGKAKAAAEERMGVLARASMYSDATGAPGATGIEPPGTPDPVVVKGHFQRLADPERDAEHEVLRADEGESMVVNFVKGMSKIAAGE
jgi:hypothetical protein